MLQSLRIEQLALIESAHLAPAQGLSVLTGESGSGKSIVFDALALVTGCARPRIRPREGAPSGLVEGEFRPERKDCTLASPALRRALEACGLLETCEADETLVLARRIERSGRTRCFIQGQVVTRAALAEVGQALVELCGQSEAHGLRTPAAQLAALDHFGGLSDATRKLEQQVRRLRAADVECEKLQKDAAEAERRRDFLEFQLEELRGSDLEDLSLKQSRIERLRIQTAEQENYREIVGVLGNDGPGVLSQLTWLAARLAAAECSLEESDALHRITEELDAIQRRAVRALQDGEAEQRELELLEEELQSLEHLARKHRVNTSELSQRREELEVELNRAAQIEARLTEAQTRRDQLRAKAKRLAEKLHLDRRRAAAELDKRLKQELEFVGLPHAQFETHLSRGDLTASGVTHLDMGFSANPGNPPQPLARVASGGELSRILLCFRLATDSRGVLLAFDEIDAGAGGQTAEKIAQALVRASRHTQVMSVTHWPQVASTADLQWGVSKESSKESTVSHVRQLTEAERVSELSRMLGGSQRTARRHAARLLDGQKKNAQEAA